MSKEKLFKELVSVLAKSGSLTESQYNLLLDKGNDLGLSKEAVDILIKLEQDFPSEMTKTSTEAQQVTPKDPQPIIDNNEYEFKSAITRGGAVLTPDTIIVTPDKIIFKKRNKFLINKDSITIPISRVSSVELDTSIIGTDITIKSYGQGVIVGNKFTKADALEIQRLIYERQKSLN
jgi:hypothetical protein